jgi:hypothetical protein
MFNIHKGREHMRKPEQLIRIYKGHVVEYCPDHPAQYRWTASIIKEVLCWRLLSGKHCARTLKELKEKINKEEGKP